MNKEKMKKRETGFIALSGITIVLLLISPTITFIIAYIGGMLLNLLVGSMLVDGLNTIFETTRFTKELIPLLCAIFATIGNYFKEKSTRTN